MALSRVKTWSAGEVLTASDLNSEFNNILNNARSLISPLTGSLDMDGYELVMDADADSSLTADTDDRLDVRLGGVDLFIFDGTTASSVNGATFTSSITGREPSISATGSDSNINLRLIGKGTGGINAPVLSVLGMIGGKLSHSRSLNAETIAIKTHAGNDPSATEPVFVLIRNATATTSGLTVITLSTAYSLTISSGSTMGARSSVAFRLWFVLFDDAGTYRFGAINCVTTVAGAGAGSDVTAIFPLSAWGIASSTAEGGAGAADSAQTFYTGTAVTSKPYIALGYSTWESGLGTAGTWGTAPDRTQIFGLGVALPGRVVQSQRTDTGASATGTTTVPADDTIPQNTEGDQYMAQAITPSSAANVLNVKADGQFATSGVSAAFAMSLHQDAVANALKTAVSTPVGAGLIFKNVLGHSMLAATTSATTMKIRAGLSGAGTTTFNGSGGSRFFGGVLNSIVEVQEVMG